jgi:hypothetical protein
MKRVLILALLLVSAALILGFQPKTKVSTVIANQQKYKSKYPSYCCTSAGKLGPYKNDSVEEGGACYGTDSKGQRQEGTACFGEADKATDGESKQKYKSKYPSYCCTSAGKLGPYKNDSVEEGGACYGTDSRGQRQEGTACFGKADEKAQ